ncbi:MAG TPA: hypothetical protein VFN53_13635, partial [Acidobacteriaceae bacterium]|nr:hypothetical protein [Acidobacteriaceae bacterium]
MSWKFRTRSEILRAIVCTVFVVVLTGRASLAADNNASHYASGSPWVATWGAAMLASNHSAPDFSAETLRQIVHVSVGGDQTRVWFSNRFGQAPLRIGSAHVALSAQGNS